MMRGFLRSRDAMKYAMPCAARIACIAIGAVVPSLARAEPVTDRGLSGIHMAARKDCEVFKVSFNYRVRYASHFPQVRGTELRISVRAIDPGVAASESLTRREALRPPVSKLAKMKAIELDLDPAQGPTLVVQFHQLVAFQVGQGADFESVIIAVSGPRASASCRPEFHEASAWTARVTPAPSSGRKSAPEAPAPASIAARPKTRGTGTLSDADRREVGAAMDEGRAALKKNNLAVAIARFVLVLQKPENEFSAEAQELLGLARQRNSDPAEAKAEYEDYLNRYPTGEGADRVRQRLAALLTANGETPASKGSSAADLPSASPRKKRSGTDGSSSWSVSGSASQFYIRDDSFHALQDPSLPPDVNPDPDAHRVHQNQLQSSLDLVGVWSNPSSKWKLRFSGTQEHDIAGQKDEIVGVAALFLETAFRDWDVDTRIGRQTRNTGGVLGRFDGAVVSWHATPWLSVDVVGGSPVARRYDEPYLNDRLFYGASVDIGQIWGGLDLTLFAIEQRDREWIDRQAIGAEVRYVTSDFSGFATLDYDIHFADFNAAIFTGTWTMADRSTLNAGVEYRKSPYLSAWTALQGQPFITLYDLLAAQSATQVDQLAIDRTATYRSATLGYSRPLTDHLQFSADVTMTDTSGTVASGGVVGMPSTGLELYYSAQLIANSMFNSGDMYIVGLRLADREDSDLYVLDFNSRYPLTDSWRVGPRLRLGYRYGDDLKEYSVLPSMLVDYYWTRDLSLEIEVGAQWTETHNAGVLEDQTDLFFTVGYRYDFYADGLSKCSLQGSVCR